MSDEISPNRLVEVAPGRLKPFGRCTPAEKRRADRLLNEKQQLITRWVELLDDLGEDWIPQTELVMRMGGAAIGHGSQPNATLPEWETEIEALEAAREFKQKCAGSDN